MDLLNYLYKKIDKIDVARYGKTRNYLSGAVTKLSPYISRGVISHTDIALRILSRYSVQESRPLVYQLAWREYFQKIWLEHGERIFTDWYQTQHPVERSGISKSVIKGETGIEILDTAIMELYNTGYMHNHVRMYIASLLCNIGRYHWMEPACWMYYHLLDGDLASNMLSWQWVAGTFSHKKYYFNQDNINHYCGTSQRNTFLDKSYQEIMRMSCPEALSKGISLQLKTKLPACPPLKLDYTKPLLLYTTYTLNPLWHAGKSANRVLVLEPSHFKRFPVSEKVMEFVLQLTNNIPELQVFTGEVTEIPGISDFSEVIAVKHPLALHFPAKLEEPKWLFPDVQPTGSFSSFWKKCEVILSFSLNKKSILK